MKSFRFLAVSAAALALLLAVLGSWVRINGAGMTCPDWPLCKGSLIPLLQGGVVLEWSHRFVAMVEGFVLAAAIIAGWRVRHRIAGIGPVFGALAIIFVVQVVLGGLTVQLSNRPDSVVWHWATAMALLATLTVLAVLATTHPPRLLKANRTTAVLSLAAFCGFIAMAAGAYVSSSGAGLACPYFPNCSEDFWARGPLQLAQMIHRVGAAVFALAAMTSCVFAWRQTIQVRYAALAGTVLMTLQIALGIANVHYELPTLLRESHAANAVLTFISFVIAATLSRIPAKTLQTARVETVRGESSGATRSLQGVSK